MHYYIWSISDDYPESLIGEYQRDRSPDRFDLKKGEILPNDWGIPIIKFHAPMSKLSAHDSLEQTALVPLVSQRFVDLLMEYSPESIQLIPAKVEATDGVLNDYFIINITTLDECIDIEKSEYSTIPGTDHPMAFSKLVFRDCVKPKSINRDSFTPRYTIVGEELKLAIEDLLDKEVRLVLPEDVG